MKKLWGRKSEKQFAIPGDQIRPVASGHGFCFATDEITVDGKPVGYMVRSHPASAGDSGWVFMSGDETQAYMDDPGNTAIYDVNTIANYDAEIIPYLAAPAGSSFARQRDQQSGDLGPLRPGQ